MTDKVLRPAPEVDLRVLRVMANRKCCKKLLVWYTGMSLHVSSCQFSLQSSSSLNKRYKQKSLKIKYRIIVKYTWCFPQSSKRKGEEGSVGGPQNSCGREE